MRYAYFEFVVMLFKLMNVIAMFIDLMNKIFEHYLDKIIVVFIDDLLVCSKSSQGV